MDSSGWDGAREESSVERRQDWPSPEWPPPTWPPPAGPPPQPGSGAAPRSRKRTVSLSAGLVVGILGLIVRVVLVVDQTHRLAAATATAAPATPTTEAGPTTLGIPASDPGWVPISIDHPAPGTTPLPPVLTQPSASAAAVITPAQAQSVLTAMWSLRQEAFRSKDRSLMAEFESGSALEADEVTCGCDSRLPRGPITKEALFLPRQTSYPASFMAEASTTLAGSSYVQYLVIARRSESTPWSVVADPGDAKAGLDQTITDRSGFDVAPTPPHSGRGLPAVLAGYWQDWTDTGRAPSSSQLAPGYWTTGYGAELATKPQGSLVSSNELNGYYLYRASDADPSWSFGTASGGITCGTLRTQTYWTSPTGVYQPPAQDNWGPTVAPGTYQADAETDIVQPCFIQQHGRAVEVTSGILDPDTEQGIEPGGIPAAPPPTSPVQTTPLTEPATPAATMPAATPVPASCVSVVPYEQTQELYLNQRYRFELPSDAAPCLVQAGLSLGSRLPDNAYYHVHIDMEIAGGETTLATGIGTDLSNGKVTGLFTESDTGIVWFGKSRSYTLGQLFEEWGQPLAVNQIGRMRLTPGQQIYWFVDGSPVANPAGLVLHNHDEIQAFEDLQGSKINPISSFAWPPGY